MTGVAKVPGYGDGSTAVIGGKARGLAQFGGEAAAGRGDHCVIVENQAGGQHILDHQVVDGPFRGAQRQGVGDGVADGRFCGTAVTLADGDAGDGECGGIDVTVGVEATVHRRIDAVVFVVDPFACFTRIVVVKVDQSASTVLTWLPSTTAALVTAAV